MRIYIHMYIYICIYICIWLYMDVNSIIDMHILYTRMLSQFISPFFLLFLFLSNKRPRRLQLQYLDINVTIILDSFSLYFALSPPSPLFLPLSLQKGL